MDIRKPANQDSQESKPEGEKAITAEKKSTATLLGMEVGQDVEMLKNFFNLSGGSLFYCLSAVFVAYGIAKVMGPILSGEGALREVLPCIFTLHAYEVALLGVLVLIVSKKVVDDAISIVVLIALFLVGTSIALGSVADKNISASFWIGLISIALALGKLFVMRRWAGIELKVLSVAGVVSLVACNYVGPVIMARAISVDPSQEVARRGLWMYLWAAMLIAGIIVLIEAMRGKHQPAEQNERAFLQSPIMVYVFALILLSASGIHQYSMAFTFALERVIGDFVPVTLMGTLLLLEILRHSGKRFGLAEIIIGCLPLAIMMFAIEEKSVLASREFGPGLICYPPVILAISGLSIGVLAFYRRWRGLIPVAAAYGLGVILTVGFSPEHPHDLNTHACAWTLVAALLVYGIVVRNQLIYLAGVVVLCIDLVQLDAFSVFVRNLHLTELGGLAGVSGLCCMAFYLLFGQRLHRAVQIFGAVCVAGFFYDYLPGYIHWKDIIALLAIGCLMALLWFRRKDVPAMAILCVPLLIKLYILAKRLAYWRFVILGFLLLAAGTVASILKSRKTEQITEDGPGEMAKRG